MLTQWLVTYSFKWSGSNKYSRALLITMQHVCLQVRENIDDLFEREELSAAPDVGWPDCFNSGVFVFKPSLDTYASLLQLACSHGSFDGQLTKITQQIF